MTRFVSVLIVIALIAGSVSPLAAVARPETGMPVDICPMMDHTPQDEPCIGQPCPCHGNGTETSALPDGTRLALPEGTAVPARTTVASSLPPAHGLQCQPGFLATVDHPPDIYA